jgi:hypothetical protein
MLAALGISLSVADVVVPHTRRTTDGRPAFQHHEFDSRVA